MKPRPRGGLSLAQRHSSRVRSRATSRCSHCRQSFLPRPGCWRPGQGRSGSVLGSAGQPAERGLSSSPVRCLAAHSSSHQDPGQVDRLGHGLQGLRVTHQVPLVGEEGELSPGGWGSPGGGAVERDGKVQGAGAGGQPGDLWGCHPLPKPLGSSLSLIGPGSSPLGPLPPLLRPFGSSHPPLAPPPTSPRPLPSCSV